MKFRLSLILPLVLLGGGCLNPVVRSKPVPVPPTPPAFEDEFREIGRVETGVPILNKIPFLNRYFMNVSIGRDGFIWDRMPLSSAVVSKDGTWLLVGRDQGGAVSIFNLQDAKDHTSDLVPSRNDAQPNEPGSQAAWLAMLPDNSSFFVYRIRNNSKTPVLETMELFDRATGMLQRVFPIEPGFQTAAVSPDGKLLYCVGKTSLEAWNVQTGEKAASVPLQIQDGVTKLQCTQNPPCLFLATQAGQVRIFDRNTLAETASLSTGSEPVLIDISPDGSTLMAACSEKVPDDITFNTEKDRIFPLYCCKIRLYEIGTWNLLREITPDYPHHYNFGNIRFSSDGTRLIGHGVERFETPAVTSLGTFLAEYDLSESNGSWKKLEYATLPLHSEGKLLLDGRRYHAGIGSYLSPFSERFDRF